MSSTITPTWAKVAKSESKLHRPYKISNFSGFKHLSGKTVNRAEKLETSNPDILHQSGNLSQAHSEPHLTTPWKMQASFHNTEAKRLKEIDHFVIRGSRLGEEEQRMSTTKSPGQSHIEGSLKKGSLFFTDAKIKSSHTKIAFFKTASTSHLKIAPSGGKSIRKQEVDRRMEALKEQEYFMRQKNTLPNIIGFDFK